uniref:Uncharacterized protein n=1 Tax=Meloidogyne enterolobii TaxID=390850 RepID=A0A6V7Y3M9_MELEN|nr:unnamed protein product [Meloidogyne enterolobii]
MEEEPKQEEPNAKEEGQNPQEEGQNPQNEQNPQNPKKEKESEVLQYLKYKAQTEQEILELNTDEDKVTTITEKNIIKKVRDVYGQRAADMIGSKIDWASWGVEMNPKERPNPYDFPAFLRAVEDVGEKKGGGGKHRKGEKSGYKSNKRSKKASKDLEGLDTKSAAANEDYSKLPGEEELFPNDGGGGGGGKAGRRWRNGFWI